ncbi:transcriptional regulator [Geomonas sp. Red32]|uniref:transcriptional regulator n=1 Tax=Geomonas sp. Red32 TaxID=2912856 RepID=UPI00202CD87F|nr:transcriptional regulator [Geomonas sp. Red32]MCM0084487.1 transcriptional regulator [Geomonas sp. Red32]
MKSHAKRPTTPVERPETLRQEIVALLTGEILTAKDLSGQMGISEKDVLDHLEHVRTALQGELAVVPAQCLDCGFEFRKRERLKAPGKCPVCRGERITDPSFTIR